MPHSDDPDGLVFDFIEEPVWTHYHFTKGQVREFGEKSSRVRKFL